VINKFEKEILVVERELLFDGDYFEGFSEKGDYESRILNNFKYMRRGSAENDPRHKQPIGYALIVNPITKKVFAFKRTNQNTDGRMHNKWSWGVGGHIERIEEEEDNPVYAGLLRELREEVEMGGEITGIKVLGYINDDSDEVGQVHFGVLYLIETDSKEIKPKNHESIEGDLMEIRELNDICLNPELEVESWSNIALAPLKKYLS
tara:strand:- start:214 stop:831 length:618 start_codon:yes stop_codon:yes gene_type:complete